MENDKRVSKVKEERDLFFVFFFLNMKNEFLLLLNVCVFNVCLQCVSSCGWPAASVFEPGVNGIVRELHFSQLSKCVS